MKTLSPNVFTKHLYASMCTLFFFLSVSFNAHAQATVQCQNGLTMSLTSDLVTDFTAIPFGTPITFTTTVTNTGPAQTFDLELSLNPNPPIASEYEVLCADDYSLNGDVGKRNNVFINAGATIETRMRVTYSTFTFNQSPSGRNVTATLFTNNIPSCSASLLPPVRNNVAIPLGVPGQTTTVNTFGLNSPGATGSLIIRGNVTLNLDHTVLPVGNATDAFIYMDEGATLTIPNGRTLSLQNARVFGIRAMWNSIIVESGGTLAIGSINRTTIKDGIRAIEARAGSNINIFNTYFEDNLTSLFVAPTAGNLQNINFINPFTYCDFNGTGELRRMPTTTPNCDTNKIAGHPYTGLDINDLGSLLTVGGTLTPRTTFRNMSNGILARRTRLFVNRTKFENIKSDYTNSDGHGIYSLMPNSLLLVAGNSNSQDLDFSNCSIGITYQHFGMGNLAQINSLEMDNTNDVTGVGVQAIANYSNDSYIYNMGIRAKTPIRSFLNTSRIGEIYQNLLDATYPPSPSTSNGIYASENSSTGNWNIYGNAINVQNAQHGIRFNSGTNAIITDNGINIESYSPTDSKGFYSGGSSNFTVSCNNIGVAGGTASFSDRAGLYMVNGSGSAYTCNNTRNSQVGLNIIGECRPFSMSGNRFNNHAYGLVLNNETFIGEQNLRGNKWQGPFTVSGAKHLDPDMFDVLQSQFKVGTSNTPILPTFIAAASNWFQFIGGTDFTCGTSNACPNGSPAGLTTGGGGDDNEAFYRSAMSEARRGTSYAEETKWTAQRNAYGRLVDNPSEQSNRDITAFVGRMRNSSIGQLYLVEKGMKGMKNIGEEHRTILTRNTNSIKDLANEIAELDAKIITTKGREQAEWVARKKEKNSVIHRLSTENTPRHDAIERKRKQEIQRLIRDNERISTRLQPEINEKEVNAVYLMTVAQGNMALNDEQKELVRVIAYQCPQEGGNAVFAARSLYSLVENVNFDDLALCNVRSEPIQGLKIKRNESYKISPNPASDVLTVSQSSEQTEVGEWLIFDMAGKLLISQNAQDNNAVNINIQSLSEGIYFISFSVNGQKRFNQKLVKIKSN